MAETVRLLGGVTTWAALREVHPARLIRRATTAGVVVRPGRGRYVLPTASEHLRRSQSRGAALSHLSAALHHGWAVKTVPDRPGSPCAASRTSARASSPESSRAGPSSHRTTSATASRHRCARCSTAPGRSRSTRRWPSPIPPCERGRHRRRAHCRRCVPPRARRASSAARRRPCGWTGGQPLRVGAARADHRGGLRPHPAAADRRVRAVRRRRPRQRGAAARGRGRRLRAPRHPKRLRKDCRRHTEFAVYDWSSLRFSFEDVMYEQVWVRWALRSWRTSRGRQPTTPPLRSW